jgi:hypothetical protein
MADEPVSRILRAKLQMDKLFRINRRYLSKKMSVSVVLAVQRNTGVTIFDSPFPRKFPAPTPDAKVGFPELKWKPHPAIHKEDTTCKGTKFGTLAFAVLLFLAYSVTTRAQDAGTQESKAQAQTENGTHHGQHAGQLERLSKELN